MNRAEKTESIESIERDFGRATVAVVAQYRGLSAGQLNHLRKSVREVDGRCRVAKNRLAKRAVAGGSYAPIATLLRGPTAIVLGFNDPVAVAKTIIKLESELPALEVKGAVLEGQVLAPEGLKALATLPSREVLLAQLLGLLQAPAAQLLRTINEPGAQVARLMDALAKRAGGAEA